MYIYDAYYVKQQPQANSRTIVVKLNLNEIDSYFSRDWKFSKYHFSWVYFIKSSKVKFHNEYYTYKSKSPV